MNPFMQIRSNDYSWSDMNDGCPVTHSRLRIARQKAKLGGQVRRESLSLHSGIRITEDSAVALKV